MADRCRYDLILELLRLGPATSFEIGVLMQQDEAILNAWLKNPAEYRRAAEARDAAYHMSLYECHRRGTLSR